MNYNVQENSTNVMVCLMYREYYRVLYENVYNNYRALLINNNLLSPLVTGSYQQESRDTAIVVYLQHFMA